MFDVYKWKSTYFLLWILGSARSAHSNAYFYGFFKAKRIVLYDTLIKGYSIHENTENLTDKEKDLNEKSKTEKEEEENTIIERKSSDNSVDENQKTEKKKADKGCESDEVLAVLCHEFGHWSLSHNLINLCISFVRMNILYLFVYYRINPSWIE